MSHGTLTPEQPAREHDGPDEGSGEAIYTRYCAAPQPRSLHEPRYIHALMLAAWLGRLIDPIDLAHQSLADRQAAARHN